MIKVPISMDGASFTGAEVEEQRQDGTRATELSLIAAVGHALDFDGVDDVVTCGSDASLADVFDGGGSLSFWIYPRSDGEANIGRPLAKFATNFGWAITTHSESTGKVKLDLYYFFSGADGHWQTISTEVNLNEWSHIVYTYNNDNVANNPIIYVNTRVVALTEAITPTGTRGTDAAQVFNIGNNATTSNTFDGQIDEVGVWSEILSANDVSDLYNDGNGLYINKDINWPTDGGSMGTNLQGLWHLDEGAGSSAADSSANTNTGTLVNMEENDWVTGKISSIFPASTDITLADLDSGTNNPTWDMSTIEIFENPNSEAGSIKYKYAYGNSASPSNWNASWLTKAELKAETDPSGRYFKLKSQFTGDGNQDVTLSDGWIEVSIPGGEQSHAYIE